MQIADVWDELMAVERRMDDFFREVVGPRARTHLGTPWAVAPAIDVYKKDGELVTKVELPGIDPEKDVTVTIEDGDLVIRGVRRNTEEVNEEDHYRKETSYGTFERRTTLPKGVQEADVRADYQDGILEVRVPAPKVEAPEATSIPITTAGKSQAA